MLARRRADAFSGGRLSLGQARVLGNGFSRQNHGLVTGRRSEIGALASFGTVVPFRSVITFWTIWSLRPRRRLPLRFPGWPGKLRLGHTFATPAATPPPTTPATAFPISGICRVTTFRGLLPSLNLRLRLHLVSSVSVSFGRRNMQLVSLLLRLMSRLKS